MRIVILGGTGALAAIFGESWTLAGHDVVLVGRDPEKVQAIREHGITVVRTNPTHYQPIIVCQDEIPTEADLSVLLVKSFDTASALELAPKNCPVLSLQNGLNHQSLMKAHGESIVGVTTQGGTRVSVTEVLCPTKGLSLVGSFIATELSTPLTPFEFTSAIELETWKKLCLNLCTLPAAVIFRLKAADLPNHADSLQMMQNLLREGVAVAAAKGLQIDFDERWATLSAFFKIAGEGKSSMLQDFEAGRPLEFDAVTGGLIRAGLGVGVPTPYAIEANEKLRSLSPAYPIHRLP